jgi:NAD(P)-dependent dehydrogenase (short-subunit alcohol dehydrogenase family)
VSEIVDPAQYLLQCFGLRGLTAVVIGGNGTLGSAIARALASAGAHVMVVGRDEGRCRDVERAIIESGGSAQSATADTASRVDLEAIAATLQSEGRFPDILVNGAGTNSPTPFLEIGDDEWDRIFRINVTGIRASCQVFGQQLLSAGRPGSIINIASLSAITPLSRVFTYSASKAAVLNLTLNLAREWAAHGIRVNALSPGFFPAEQNRRVLTPDRVENIMRHTPMGRFGEPHELAGAVLLMAAPTAGSFLTGHNLVVDGGFTAMTI